MSAAIGLGARIVLAAVFVAAAIAKVQARETLGPLTAAVIPNGASVAPFIPVLECALAVALLVDRASPTAAIATGVVLVIFTIVVVRAELLHVPCPCFGASASARPAGPEAVVRNGVLLLLAVAASLDASGAEIGATVAAVVALGAIAGVAVRRAA